MTWQACSFPDLYAERPSIVVKKESKEQAAIYFLFEAFEGALYGHWNGRPSGRCREITNKAMLAGKLANLLAWAGPTATIWWVFRSPLTKLGAEAFGNKAGEVVSKLFVVKWVPE